MDLDKMFDFDNDKVKEAIIIVVAFIIASAVISIFSRSFYASRFLEYQAQEIGNSINNGGEFNQVARQLLDARNDIAYLKLLGGGGEIKESFGNDSEEEGIRRFRLSVPGNQTVMFGLREIEDRDSITSPLLWSVLIGMLFAGICVFGVFSLSFSPQPAYLERLINAIKRVSRGDLMTKLDVDKVVQKDTMMIRLYESFNQMVDQLRRREGTVIPESARFQPTIIPSLQKEEAKQKRITTFVAKISDFEELSQKLNAGELTSFLAEYRKTASTVVSSYGGVIESLLQDEIVALFNTPEEQDNPELKAVCTGVELLQILANMNMKRKVEGKHIISGKVGIEVKPMPFYGDADSPQGVEGVIDLARRICENAPHWNILVSSDLYESVSDYVEVREFPAEDRTLFSVIAVEDEVGDGQQ